MATKPVLKKAAGHANKARPKVKTKPAKPAKSIKTKAKTKTQSRPARKPAKPVKTVVTRKKVESRTTKVVRASSKTKPAKPTRPTRPAKPAKPIVAPKPRPLAGALNAYEAGIKLMYTENYQKAIKAFNDLILAFPEEPEIQASARARIHACEMKIHDRARSVYRSADDHYNIAVALMNRGEIDPAITHLQSALKLAPKGDHILYAMAAANALRGNKDQALSYLNQSIHHRPENRFQAAKDNDFAALNEEPSFKELLSLSDK